jgi:hypothetical protein
VRNIFIVVLILLLAPAAAWGQAQTTGQISGTVAEESGAPVAGARVTVTQTATDLERSTTTGKNGQFLFGVLPIGDYTVLVEATGLQPQVYSFRLGIGQTVPIEAALLPGDVATEEIEVFATATALETVAAVENFDYAEKVEELPLSDRDIQDVAMLSPVISPNGPHTNSDRDASGAGYSIAGALTTDSVTLLDGAEVSDPFFGSAPILYLEDAVEEIQVLTSGVSARYGRFQGGVINAVTKSGGNEYEATLRLELENEDWNSASPFGEAQQDDLKETYQGTVGGYVLKDRLWFFAGARTIPTSSEANTTGTTGESVLTTDAEDRWQVKLRAAPAPNHVLAVSHLDFERERDNRQGLTAGDLAAFSGARLDDRTADSLSYQGVLTDSLFLDVQATRKEVGIFSGGDPANGDPLFDLTRGQVFNNHWWDYDDPSGRDNETLAANVTKSLDAAHGTHTIEAGVQYVNSTTSGDNRQSSTGFNLLLFNTDFFQGQDAGGNSLFNLRTGNARRWEAIALGAAQDVENTALYVQDTLDVGSWRFDVGLRYDKVEGSGPLPTFDLDFEELAPRLGVTYNLAPSWQIVGTWGKYVGRFNDGIGNNITGVSGAPRIDRLYVGPDLLGLTGDQVGDVIRNEAYWDTILNYVDPTQPTQFLADGLDAPYAEDFNLSIRHALADNAGSISLSYVNRDFRDILEDFVGDACSFGLTVDGLSCPAANTTTIVDPAGNTAVVDTTIWSNTAAARRDYQAFTASWDLRPGDRWAVGGNYTFSEAQGNFEGEATNQPGIGSEIGNFERSRPEENGAPFGAVDEDVAHRINAWGTYRFRLPRDSDLAIAGLFQYVSGTVYNLTANVGYADDPSYVTDAGNTYVHFFGGRGQNHFDDFWSFDVSARYELPVFSNLRAWVKLTVDNVLDNDALVSFDTSGGAQTVNGILQFSPVGNCGLDDEPSVNCSGFGKIRNENDYQIPREVFLTVGLRF